MKRAQPTKSEWEMEKKVWYTEKNHSTEKKTLFHFLFLFYFDFDKSAQELHRQHKIDVKKGKNATIKLAYAHAANDLWSTVVAAVDAAITTTTTIDIDAVVVDDVEWIKPKYAANDEKRSR